MEQNDLKVLVQTNKRNQVQLEQEFKIIEAAGCTPVPYGYVINDNVVSIRGLESIAYDECVFNRPSIQILKRHFVDKATFEGEIPRGFFTSLDYNVDRFRISKMKANPLMVNKYPGMHKFLLLKEALNTRLRVDAFYKPDNDLKLIGGIVVPKDTTLLEALESEGKQYNFSDANLNAVMLQSINTVEFKEEIRCFVVNGKPITAGRYRRNGKHDLTPLTALEEAVYLSHANIFVKDYYSPGKSFTIDLGRLKDNSINIIEYNCINTSGYYNINAKALFSKIKENICLQRK